MTPSTTEPRGMLTGLRSRLIRAARAFREDATPPLSVASNLDGRLLDATAANLIAVREKVLQIHEGQIPLPEVVELFLTNHCRFRCPHCRCAKYHGDQTESLSVSVFTRLLDELVSKQVRIIELGGGGEPLDHPAIAEILRALIVKQCRVGLITNGYAFTSNADLIDLVLTCGDWVRFSVDGVSDSTYRAVHGCPDLSYQALREVMANMVSKVRRQPGFDQRPKIGAKLVAQKTNQHQLLEAVDEAERLGLHYLQFKWLENHTLSIPQNERISLTAVLRHRVAELPAGSLIVDVLPGYGGSRLQSRCLMSVLHPLIDWDGTVYMCAFFHHRKTSHSIGNINRRAFFDFWGSHSHRTQIQQVNPQQCIPNCPLLRYNPVIEFIAKESFRFPYI